MAGVGRASRSSPPAEGLVAANGFERARIVEIQRARMLAAMLDVVLERGVGSVTVAHVTERSGVSRRTFYEIFSDREECFLAAFDDALERIASVLVPAYESQGPTQRARSWLERVRAALTEVLGLFDEQPGIARLVVVESLAAGGRALERRNRALVGLIAAVDEGRGEARGSELSVLTAEGVVGGVCAILYARLSPCPGTGVEDRGRLVELVGPLVGMIVLPYLGKAAATRELERPAPPPRTIPHRSTVYRFGDLGMRLTYRTLRVLDAVASNPDSTNRQVGETAGIADQGQISKLLSRLRRLELIENAGGSWTRGEPNAWRLTEQGRGMHGATRASLTTKKDNQEGMD